MSLFDFGIGGLYKGAKSFMNPELGYTKAQEAQQPYYQEAQAHLQPWANQGQEAYGHLNGAMQNLLNPEQLQNQWSQNYQTSPHAQQEINRAQEYGQQAASSMGVSGSSPALQAIQQGSSNIMNADRENYLKRLTEMYFNGANLARGIYGQGSQFAQLLGQNANQQGEREGGYAFGKQRAPGQLFGALLGTAAGLAVPGAGGSMQQWATGGQ